MNALTKGNWGLKLLSLLMAVVMWVYVSNDQTTTKEQEFKAVPVEVRGLEENLAASQAPGNVTVRVQADQNVIAELTSRSVEAYVDLALNNKAGRTVVPVQVKVPAGVRVIELRPAEVTVVLEPMAEKQVPVKVHMSSGPEAGYKVLGTQVKPGEVVMRGPRSVLNRVDQVTVEVDLDKRNQSFGEAVPVRVSNTSGKLPDEGLVKINPDVAEVFVFIAPDMPSKKVKVIPVITGEPADGYFVTMTSIEPADLVIAGESDVINNINGLYTKPVDITGAKTDLLVETEPVLPPNIMVNRQSVRILVKIGRE